MTEICSPPYRIETARSVVRCYNPEDSALLTEAINENLEHLRPWMPWALDEPESVEKKAQRLREYRGKFDLDEEYLFGIFSQDETQFIGSTGLHTRIGPGALEIGYWVASSHVNRGLATEVIAALVKVAFEICKVERIEIRCDPKNEASARIPQKLGFTHDATLRARDKNTKGELVGKMIWSLLASEYSTSTSAEAKIIAYDAMCKKMLP